MRKSVFLILIYALLATALLLYSCAKEYSCEGCLGISSSNNNKPPIAKAGPDQTTQLPLDSVALNGNASFDPDGFIRSYNWKQIAGPSAALVLTPDSSKTVVKALLVGVYAFELTVNDNGGLQAKDTVQVLVTNSSLNSPPVACAGPDQMITLPNNTASLNGSCSFDPDNNIVGYQWRKLSGPASYNFSAAGAVQTNLSNLVAGAYVLELMVTDAGGLSSKDTVVVTVLAMTTCGNISRPIVQAQLLPVGVLSQERTGITIASAANKILFAGGQINSVTGTTSSARVDIYDIITNSWTTASLSTDRFIIATATAGSKIFFAGGVKGPFQVPVNSVDIYDAATNTWAVAQLSSPGSRVAAATVGNKVMFIGGEGRGHTIDVYNLVTNTWSTTQLPHGKEGYHSAVTVGNKVYIAGGFPTNGGLSNIIDIYDDVTNSWSVDTLIELRAAHATAVVGNKIYWAGGFASDVTSWSCSVEIKDIISGTTSLDLLHRNMIFDMAEVGVRNNKIVFFAGDFSDMYDVSTGSWSILAPPGQYSYDGIIVVNNEMYIVGWNATSPINQVWKMSF